MTEFFLIKERSELPKVVVQFYNEILLQFNLINVSRFFDLIKHWNILKTIMNSFYIDKGTIH